MERLCFGHLLDLCVIRYRLALAAHLLVAILATIYFAWNTVQAAYYVKYATVPLASISLPAPGTPAADAARRAMLSKSSPLVNIPLCSVFVLNRRRLADTPLCLRRRYFLLRPLHPSLDPLLMLL